jgi:hypothetical protein
MTSRTRRSKNKNKDKTDSAETKKKERTVPDLLINSKLVVSKAATYIPQMCEKLKRQHPYLSNKVFYLNKNKK